MFFLSSIFNVFLYSFCISLSVWTWNTQPTIRAWVEANMLSKVGIHISNTQDVKLLATLFSVDHCKKLLQHHDTKNIKTMSIRMLYSPCLMLHVKHVNKDGDPIEGFLAWDMKSGELLMDPSNWTTSKGIADLLFDGFSEQHLSMLTKVATNTHLRTHDPELYTLEGNEPEKIIQECTERGLITYSKGKHILHMQNPKIPLSPPIIDAHERRILNMVPYQEQVSSKAVVNPEYTEKQITHSAAVLFGKNFYIKSSEIIYFPVYMLKVTKTTGEVTSTYFNAYTGLPVSL